MREVYCIEEVVEITRNSIARSPKNLFIAPRNESNNTNMYTCKMIYYISVYQNDV